MGEISNTEPTKDAPAFDFFPERWLAGVAQFSDAEQLSYLRLLCHQWLEQGLPNDIAKLKRLAGKGVTADLLLKFPVGTDGMRRNAKLEALRHDQRERIASKRLGGALTNAKRHGFSSLSEDVRKLLMGSERGRKEFGHESLANFYIVASEEESASLASRHQSPITNHPLIPSPPVGALREADVNAWADRIVAAYGMKDAPMKCLEYVATLLRRGKDDPAQVLAAVERCTATIRAKAPQGFGSAHVPRAESFFVDEQWRSPEMFEGRWTERKPTSRHVQGPRTAYSVGKAIDELSMEEIMGAKGKQS